MTPADQPHPTLTTDEAGRYLDLHAAKLIAEVAGIEGPLALTVWSALQPFIGHLQREAIDDYRARHLADLADKGGQ